MIHHSSKYGRTAVEDYINKWLMKKMTKRDSTRLALELGHLINSAAYGYGDTVEERAMFRDTGTRIAEYIIKTVYSDPDDVKSFMDGIMEYARCDILREKGELVVLEDNKINNVIPFVKRACI